MALGLWFAGLIGLVVAAAIASNRGRARPADIASRGAIASAAIAYGVLVAAAIWTWGGAAATTGRADRLHEGASVSLALRGVRVPLAGTIAIGHGDAATLRVPGEGPDELFVVEFGDPSARPRQPAPPPAPASPLPSLFTFDAPPPAPAPEPPPPPQSDTKGPKRAILRATSPHAVVASVAAEDPAVVAMRRGCKPDGLAFAVPPGATAVAIECADGKPQRAFVIHRDLVRAELTFAPLPWRGRFASERLAVRAGDVLRIGSGDAIPGLATWDVLVPRDSSAMLAVPGDPTRCDAWSQDRGATRAIDNGCRIDSGPFVIDALPIVPDAAAVIGRAARAAFAIGMPPLLLLVALALRPRHGRRAHVLAGGLRLAVLGAAFAALACWRLLWAYRIDVMRELVVAGSRVVDNQVAACALGAALAGNAVLVLGVARRAGLAIAAWAAWLAVGWLLIAPRAELLDNRTLGVFALSLVAALAPVIVGTAKRYLPRPQPARAKPAVIAGASEQDEAAAADAAPASSDDSTDTRNPSRTELGWGAASTRRAAKSSELEREDEAITTSAAEVHTSETQGADPASDDAAAGRDPDPVSDAGSAPPVDPVSDAGSAPPTASALDRKAPASEAKSSDTSATTAGTVASGTITSDGERDTAGSVTTGRVEISAGYAAAANERSATTTPPLKSSIVRVTTSPSKTVRGFGFDSSSVRARAASQPAADAQPETKRAATSTDADRRARRARSVDESMGPPRIVADFVLVAIAIGAVAATAYAPSMTLLKLGLAYAAALASQMALRAMIEPETWIVRRAALAGAIGLAVAAVGRYDAGVTLAITGTGLVFAMLVAGHDAMYGATKSARIGLLEREHARVLMVHGFAAIGLAIGVAVWAIAAGDRELVEDAAHAIWHAPLVVAVLFALAALVARSHRRGWAPWLAAALAALAMWGLRERAIEVVTAGDGVGAQRVTAHVEPGYALLGDERAFAASVSAWREAALSPTDTVDHWRGEGYFGARIRDPGVARSLDNDYLPVLVAREAGIGGLVQGILLLLGIVVAAGVLASARLRHASQEHRARSLAIGVVGVLALYQPLAALGVMPLTGISWPGLGVDSPADLWLFVIGAVWCVLAGGSPPEDERMRSTPRLVRARRVVLIALTLAGVAGVILVARAGAAALDRVATDDERIASALRYAESIACSAPERTGTTLEEVVPIGIAGEPTDDATARFDRELRASYAFARPLLVSATQACRGNVGPWKLSSRDAPTEIAKSDGVPSDTSTCVASMRVGWPEIRLTIHREPARIRATCEVIRDDHAIAALRARPRLQRTPRIRVVSAAMGVAATDVGEVVAGDTVIRLRPNAPALELAALSPGVHPGGRLVLAPATTLATRPAPAKDPAAAAAKSDPAIPASGTAADPGTSPKRPAAKPAGRPKKSADADPAKKPAKRTPADVTDDDPKTAPDGPRFAVPPRRPPADSTDPTSAPPPPPPVRRAPKGRDPWSALDPSSDDGSNLLARLAHHAPTLDPSSDDGSNLSPDPSSDDGSTRTTSADPSSDDGSNLLARLAQRNPLRMHAIGTPLTSVLVALPLMDAAAVVPPKPQPEPLPPAAPGEVALVVTPRGVVVQGPAELFVAEGVGWRRVIHGGELVLDRVTLIASGPPDRRTIVLFRPPRAWGATQVVDSLLADDASRLGDRARRVYPYGSALPELGWVNPFEVERSLGLDGWIHAANSGAKTAAPACGTLAPPPITRDRVCTASPHDGVLECRVTIQPELAQSLRSLADDVLATPKPHTGRDVQPVRAAYVVLRGDTGELLAQGNVVPGRGPLAYAPADARAEAELVRLRNSRGEADSERVEWNLPIAVGSTFKPIVARAVEQVAPQQAAALALTADGTVEGCRRRRGNEVNPILGHCPPTSVAGQPTTADLHDFLAKSPNWYQAALGTIGLALPDGQLAAGDIPITLSDILASDISRWTPEQRLTISDATGIILGKRTFSVAGMRRTRMWSRVEQLLGRPMCTLGDRLSCERASSRADTCAARALPLAAGPDLRNLVALGPDRIDPYADDRPSQAWIPIREYFQLLRGSGVHPIGSLAQLTDAFGRVVYDRSTGAPQLAASWFPAPAAGTLPEWSCADAKGHATTVLGADGGLCGVLQPGGTANTGAGALLTEPNVIIYGAKTGTIDSLADIARRPIACAAWNERHVGGPQLVCGKTPPDDSLFVIAFGVVTPKGTIPITLGIQLQRAGAGSATRVAPEFVRAIAHYVRGP